MLVSHSKIPPYKKFCTFWNGKKAQNSDFHWCPLHGEIGPLKKTNIVFFVAIFTNFYKRDLSKTNVIRKWKWHFPSKWGTKSANLNWSLLMGLDQLCTVAWVSVLVSTMELLSNMLKHVHFQVFCHFDWGITLNTGVRFVFSLHFHCLFFVHRVLWKPIWQQSWWITEDSRKYFKVELF